MNRGTDDSLSYQDEELADAGAGPSRFSYSRNSGQHLSTEEADLLNQISDLDAEIGSTEEDIKRLRSLCQELKSQRQTANRRLEALQQRLHGKSSNSKGKNKTTEQLIDYGSEFDWTPSLRAKLKSVFKINNFRLCQEAVCNASMEGRDIVCVMPTGGGKSLTYQLPAVMSPGVTLVVSPLIALMQDQYIHLKELGIEAEMLASCIPKEESDAIQKRLKAMATGRSDGKELKLCYVTPEKISKSKRFATLLQQLDQAGKLARIVIDEAHCVSQLGHDFRPDYKQLSMLRKLCPNVPILALSATCPPRVLKDLVKVLHLDEVVDGRAASARRGTVYFSSPLYRKNLHYKVVQKPAKASDVTKSITEYILTNHPDESGIIYCLSKKDAENMADEVRKMSDGKIKTGVYHSDVHDSAKLRLHREWRKGNIKVVCATIAFGLGIDKGDVRFVIHHTMSKSLDGFYQESGRAGRDGQDADCILYYRPQDGTRLSSLTFQDDKGTEKVHDMLRFAQDILECRKVQFARYFHMSAQVGLNAWSTEEENAEAGCGHCDNCTRGENGTEKRDVTVASWQLLKIAQAIQKAGGRVTLAQLADVARGVGKGQYGIAGRGRKSASSGTLDLDHVAGGPVALSKDEVEVLATHLLLHGYLEEVPVATPHSVNIYLAPTNMAARLTRFSRNDIDNPDCPRVRTSRVEVVFLTADKKGRKGKVVKRKPSPDVIEMISESELSPVPIKRKRGPLDLDSDDGVFSVDQESLSDRVSGTVMTGDISRSSRTAIDSDEEGDDDVDWTPNLRTPSSRSHPRASTSRPSKRFKASTIKSDARTYSPDVIEISSD